MSKEELRALIRQRKLLLEPEEESLQNESIFCQLSEKQVILNAHSVYCYMDQKHEAGTRRMIEFLWKKGIRPALPRVEGREIFFYYIGSYEDLEAGCMGILEPKQGCEPALDTSAPMIVPGVAFDFQKNRMGYGGGFYDRFFEREPEHYRIGIAFDFQVFPSIPAEAHDKKMDEVVTYLRSGERS